MITQKDQKALLRALDAWFDSQDVDISDRAFVCAQMAGLYQGIYVSVIRDNRKYLERGTAILQATLQRAANAAFEG